MKQKSSADKLLNSRYEGKQATILNAPLAATILNAALFYGIADTREHFSEMNCSRELWYLRVGNTDLSDVMLYTWLCFSSVALGPVPLN